MQTLMMIMTTIKMKNKTIATAGNVLPAMVEDIGEIVFDIDIDNNIDINVQVMAEDINEIIFDEMAHCALVSFIQSPS